MSSLFKFLSKYDEFGHPIGLNYRKDEEHKTVCGTTLSLLKIALLLIYLSHIAIVCITRRDPAIQYSEIFRDFEEESIEPVEVGFDIAYEMVTGIGSGTSFKFKPAEEAGVDETYFNVQAFSVEYNLEEGSKFEQIPSYKCLEFEEKTGRRPFKYMSKEKFEKKLAKATCIDMEKAEFKGNSVDGSGVSLMVLECKSDGSAGSPVCKDTTTIETVAKKTYLMTLTSQNYFAIEEYDEPIKAEIGVMQSVLLNSAKVPMSVFNVELGAVELFDTQFRIFDDVPEKELEYLTAHMSYHDTTDAFKVEDRNAYSVGNFILQEKGKLYKRRVATVFNVLEDIGGMEEAICLVMAPFVVAVARRSFQYDLVTRHMKVKKRNAVKPDLPTEPVDKDMAKSIFKMAGIHPIDGAHAKMCSMLFLPRHCHRQGANQRVAKFMIRGGEQYEQSTDVLAIIRVQHRLRILESLLFNKGQLAMIGLHKQRYMKTVSSESDEPLVRAPDSESDDSHCERDICKELENYQFNTEIDKRLWDQCILPPKKSTTQKRDDHGLTSPLPTNDAPNTNRSAQSEMAILNSAPSNRVAPQETFQPDK